MAHQLQILVLTEDPGLVASLTLVPGYQTPSSGLFGHCAHALIFKQVKYLYM